MTNQFSNLDTDCIGNTLKPKELQTTNYKLQTCLNSMFKHKQWDPVIFRNPSFKLYGPFYIIHIQLKVFYILFTKWCRNLDIQLVLHLLFLFGLLFLYPSF